MKPNAELRLFAVPLCGGLIRLLFGAPGGSQEAIALRGELGLC